MVGRFPVQADKVLPIQCEYGATIGTGKSENFIVGDRLIRLARLMRRQNIMSEVAQSQYDRERKVFVRIKPCHQKHP